MSRRVSAGRVFTALAALLNAGCVTARCRPNLSCWPSAAKWQALRSNLHGELGQPSLLTSNLENPFSLQDQSGGTQSSGWLGAWTRARSSYVVTAENANDIIAAVNFARDHNLRVAIKGTGHDYLGRSNAADSLLIWTHKMQSLQVHDAFVPRGCAITQPGAPAVTVAAGARWSEVYEAVTVKHGRYVQGGGCTTVGAVGGFIQGGGFGSWSKKYGIASASMLEAEVVTADGERRVANACQNQDLFWALRGGGGGTFGVVTRMTLMTHPLPTHFGWIKGKVTAKSDDAFKALIERFLEFYREQLSDEHWGEQIAVKGNNSLELSLAFEGMRAKDAERIWQPLRTWVEERSDRFAIEMAFYEIPGTQMWSPDFFETHAPGAIKTDERPGEPTGRFWWADDGGQVSVFWYSYQSRWIPLDRFEGAEAKRFASALFEASRHWSVGLHFNKGQAGASIDAVSRGRETAINPAVFKAAALAIVAAGGEQSSHNAKTFASRVSAAMRILRDATPGSGSYVNETDYFESDWQREFWGENYPRLLSIKRKYDPKGLFTCHHCVGSELPQK